MIGAAKKESGGNAHTPCPSRALWAMLYLVITFLLTGTRAEAFFDSSQPAPSQTAPGAQDSTGKTATAWQYDALDSLIAAKTPLTPNPYAGVQEASVCLKA